MGVWDAATPLGSESKSLGDDRIRELKAALSEALSHEFSTFPGATPSSTPIFIPGFLRGTTASRPTGDSLVEGRLYINTTLNVIERYNGATWDVVAGNVAIPTGTKMPFYQASPPTGWTAVAVNDKFMRVVTSGGSGGTSGGSGATPASTLTLAHSHTVAGHTHSIAAHDHNLDYTTYSDSGVLSDANIYGYDSDGDDAVMYKVVSGFGATTVKRVFKSGTTSDGGGSTGSAAPSTDSQLSNIAFQYADFCVGSKD